VYIAEAHPVDEWQVSSNVRDGVLLHLHRSFEERLAAARLYAEKLKLNIPTVVDGMDNAACEAFAAWPERIYIVNGKGKIHYRGGPGPYEFRTEEARAAIMELLH